jgi:hypothetical protein
VPKLRAFGAAVRRDLLSALWAWPLWTMLGWNDIRQRYRRSTLGPFWITLSMAMFIGILGVIYSRIFHVDVEVYLPFLLPGNVTWRILRQLSHDSCGAVKATLSAIDDGVMPTGYVRDIVERVTPSILQGRHAGLTRVDEFETRHVNDTVTHLRVRSASIAERLAAGTVAIVGLTYHLADGRVVLRDYLGDIGEG